MGAVSRSSRKWSSMTPQFAIGCWAPSLTCPRRARIVRDDQDATPEVRPRDALHGRMDTLAVLLARLAVGPVAVREPLLELGAREPGPGADVDLAQTGIRDHRHLVRCGDDLRRLVRPPQVARVDGVEGCRAQLLRELARLRAAGLVERRIGPALPAALDVPVGLAVPGKQERGHQELR